MEHTLNNKIPCNEFIVIFFSTDELSLFFQDLRLLIEETYRKNGGKQVVLIAHSMGGLTTRKFLGEQEKEWKKKYIRFLITLTVPWAGCVKAIESYYKGIKCFRTEPVMGMNHENQ